MYVFRISPISHLNSSDVSFPYCSFLQIFSESLFKAAWPRGFRVVSDIGIVGLELWKFCRRACRLGKFWQGRPSEKQTPETGETVPKQV